MWGEGGSCGVSANEYSFAHHVTWSTNKLWRSTSIFNLWYRVWMRRGKGWKDSPDFAFNCLLRRNELDGRVGGGGEQEGVGLLPLPLPVHLHHQQQPINDNPSTNQESVKKFSFQYRESNSKARSPNTNWKTYKLLLSFMFAGQGLPCCSLHTRTLLSVLYSTMLLMPSLRFRCGKCCDWTQNCCVLQPFFKLHSDAIWPLGVVSFNITHAVDFRN